MIVRPFSRLGTWMRDRFTESGTAAIAALISPDWRKWAMTRTTDTPACSASHRAPHGCRGSSSGIRRAMPMTSRGEAKRRERCEVELGVARSRGRRGGRSTATRARAPRETQTDAGAIEQEATRRAVRRRSPRRKTLVRGLAAPNTSYTLYTSKKEKSKRGPPSRCPQTRRSPAAAWAAARWTHRARTEALMWPAPPGRPRRRRWGL